MFILKRKIAQVIKKERKEERDICEKESRNNIKALTLSMTRDHTDEKCRLIKQHTTELEQLKAAYEKSVKEIKTDHKKQVQKLITENKKLGREIEKNYETYKVIRTREKHLDHLTAEFEGEINKMISRVHESIQPFYRTAYKVESTKRKSDKTHRKVETVLSLAK